MYTSNDYICCLKIINKRLAVQKNVVYTTFIHTILSDDIMYSDLFTADIKQYTIFYVKLKDFFYFVFQKYRLFILNDLKVWSKGSLIYNKSFYLFDRYWFLCLQKAYQYQFHFLI